MCKHQVRLSWSDTRKRPLTLENEVLVETINICETAPQVMTYFSLTLPPRTLAVINVYVYLKGNSTEYTYKVNPNNLLMDKYPNIVIIPVIHITEIQTDTIIPFIVINLSTESIFLSKYEVFGFLNQTDTEICEITTSFALKPLAPEVSSSNLKSH